MLMPGQFRLVILLGKPEDGRHKIASGTAVRIVKVQPGRTGDMQVVTGATGETRCLSQTEIGPQRRLQSREQ